MIKIGITGGIGAGKSVVARVFATLGVPVYDADSRAKWLIQNDLQLRKEIKELFGREAYDSQGNYNRGFIAQQVFKNPEALQLLNQLVHPRVYEDTQRWISQQSSPYILKEAALLEKADGKALDKLIVVTAPLALRIQRIRQRDPQRSESEIGAIMARQKTDADFLAIADFVIENDEQSPVIPQVLAVHECYWQ